MGLLVSAVLCQVPEDLAARVANHVYLDLCFSADAAASAQNHHPAEPADPVYLPGQIENLFEVHLYHLVDPAPTISSHCGTLAAGLLLL